MPCSAGSSFPREKAAHSSARDGKAATTAVKPSARPEDAFLWAIPWTKCSTAKTAAA